MARQREDALRLGFHGDDHHFVDTCDSYKSPVLSVSSGVERACLHHSDCSRVNGGYLHFEPLKFIGDRPCELLSLLGHVDHHDFALVVS